MGEKQKMWVGGIRGRVSIFQIFNGIRKEDYECVIVHNYGKSRKGKDRDMEGDRVSMGVEDKLRLIWPKDITEDFVNVIKTTRKI
jgi:hypothetical protein